MFFFSDSIEQRAKEEKDMLIKSLAREFSVDHSGVIIDLLSRVRKINKHE